ncbi:hypothetical protein RUND412_007046 [Rhizina undulata]
MPPFRGSTVFRIKNVPSTSTVANLQEILRKELSDEELQKVKVNITFVPSCYNIPTKYTLVDFEPIPRFLADVVGDESRSQMVYLEMILTKNINFYGFTQLYSVVGKEITADIVAVTGSWREKQTKKMWLPDFLPQDLPNCRTMIYRYNSNLKSRGFHTLKDYKKEFLNHLAEIRKSDESLVEAAATKGEMGALSATEDLVTATCAVMFFGTPRRGILLEDVRKMLEEESRHPRVGLLDEIENALNLEPDLNEFIKLAQGFKVVSFYERLRTAEIAKNSNNCFSRSGNYRSTLDTDSALLNLPKHLEETIPVNADHTNMVKFEYKCETFEDVVQRVQKYMNTAPARVNERFSSSVSETSAPSFHDFNVHVILPYQRNRNFCGRGDILNRLQQLLEPRSPAENQVNPSAMRTNAQTNRAGRKMVILHGMGGVGKSQIALEYAHRFSHSYTSIFWINADYDSVTKDSAFKIVDQLVRHYAARSQSPPDYQKIANAQENSMTRAK